MVQADVRGRILAAATAILREQGLAGLTQPRVAKAAAVSQSHLTYYFPTRADLRRAVLEAAIEGQMANLGGAMADLPAHAGRVDRLADALADAAHTRVLVSLVLAADDDPAFRDLYRQLVAAMRARSAAMLQSAGLEPAPAQVAMLHALGTGLAVMGVALGPEAGRALNTAVLHEMFRLLGAGDANDTGGQ